MPDITSIFNDLSHQHPSLADARILGRPGRFGFTVSHGDGTVSKIVLRKPFEHHQKLSEQELEKEVSGLRILGDTNFSRFQIPRLIGDVVPLDSEQAYAMYRMTRINGHGANALPRPLSQSEKLRCFRQAGEALAEFHETATALPADWIDTDRGGYVKNREDIAQVPGLDPAANQALTIANSYLQENKKGKIIHGDFHIGNLMIDNGNISGIVDFGRTGPTDNYLNDFNNFIARPEFPHFLRGYESVSGEIIDPDMIVMTRLHMFARQAVKYEFDEEIYEEATSEIERYLRSVSHITGHNPPSMG